jgi:hypothetical protein
VLSHLLLKTRSTLLFEDGHRHARQWLYHLAHCPRIGMRRIAPKRALFHALDNRGQAEKAHCEIKVPPLDRRDAAQIAISFNNSLFLR